jgi:stage III sporulation protein AA
MDREYLLSRYLSAAELLPRRLKEYCFRLGEAEMAEAEELRLRTASGLSVLLGGREVLLAPGPVAAEELAELVSRASAGSLHRAAASLREGFVTAEGGHRVGLCGTAVLREGRIAGFEPLSSLNVRIAREIRSAAEGLPEKLLGGGQVRSLLICSPPGGGKTTLLRDLVRRVSGQGVRVAVADERGELAAVREGVPQFELGPCTDVMSMAPRSEAVTYLIRAMNPAVLAMDEISSPREAEAAEAAWGCGAALFATAHCAGPGDLRRKPLYRQLLRQGVFELALLIEGAGNERRWRLFRREELL